MLKTALVFAKGTKALKSFSSFQHAASLSVILCKQSAFSAGFNPALISEGDPGRYIKKRFVSALYRRDDDFFKRATSAVEPPLTKNHPLP